MSTIAEESGLNLNVEPIEVLILRGLQKKVGQLFQCTTLISQATDKKLVLSKLMERNGGLTYPFLFLKMTSMEKNRDYANKAMMLNGSMVVMSDSAAEKAYRMHFLPVLLRMECSYFTNSATDVQKFANKWMFVQDAGWTPFSIMYGKTNFPIQMALDDNVSIPERDASLENTQEVVVTSNIQVRSFISQAALVETEIIRGTELVGFLGNASDGDSIRKMSQVSRDGTKAFWSFRREHDGTVTEESLNEGSDS